MKRFIAWLFGLQLPHEHIHEWSKWQVGQATGRYMWDKDDSTWSVQIRECNTCGFRQMKEL